MIQGADGLELSAIKTHVDILCQHNVNVRLSGGNHLTDSGQFSGRAHQIGSVSKDWLVIAQLLVHPQYTTFYIVAHHVHFGIP